MLDINFHELEDLNTNEMFFLRQKRLQKYNQHDPASLIAKRKQKKQKRNRIIFVFLPTLSQNLKQRSCTNEHTNSRNKHNPEKK
jgi:hypothetical protein